MLRIINQQTEAETELIRIGSRTHNDDTRLKEETVREIIAVVREKGDRALMNYTEKFDRQVLTEDRIRVSGSELDAAYQQISQDLLHAIQLAAQKIEAFHRQRVPKS